MSTDYKPVATFDMLIRKPAEEVFEALADPAITTRFWFTKSSGRLEQGKTVTWEWEQFGVQADISVTELKKNRLIMFKWPADDEGSVYRTVDITFEPKADKTFVIVVESGFSKDDSDLVEQVAGQTGGWALVLSAMKAWLEYGIDLRLVSDHHPKES